MSADVTGWFCLCSCIWILYFLRTCLSKRTTLSKDDTDSFGYGSGYGSSSLPRREIKIGEDSGDDSYADKTRARQAPPYAQRTLPRSLAGDSSQMVSGYASIDEGNDNDDLHASKSGLVYDECMGDEMMETRSTANEPILHSQSNSNVSFGRPGRTRIKSTGHSSGHGSCSPPSGSQGSTPHSTLPCSCHVR